MIKYFVGSTISRPSNVQVSQINRHQLVVTWKPVYKDCPALHYSISATNCGECPSITYSNSIACNISSLILPQVCSIAIQAVACSDSHGPTSEQLTVSLQGLAWLSSTMDLGIMIILLIPCNSLRCPQF